MAVNRNYGKYVYSDTNNFTRVQASRVIKSIKTGTLVKLLSLLLNQMELSAIRNTFYFRKKDFFIF